MTKTEQSIYGWLYIILCLGWVDFPSSSIFILHPFVHIKIYIKCIPWTDCMVLDINYLIVCKEYTKRDAKQKKKSVTGHTN